MNKRLTLLLLSLIVLHSASAQYAKKHAPGAGAQPDPARLTLSGALHPAVPPAEGLFGIPAAIGFQPLPALNHLTANAPDIHVVRDQDGTPILFRGRTEASALDSDQATPEATALAYIASLRINGWDQPGTAFEIAGVHSDESGNFHVRLQQTWQGLSVFGAELIAHSHQGYFDMLNGRLAPPPRLTESRPTLDVNEAILIVQDALGPNQVKTSWNDVELRLIGGKPYVAELVVYPVGGAPGNARLAWHIVAHPNLLKRYVYFVDAMTGDILNAYDHTCKIDGGRHDHTARATTPEKPAQERTAAPALLDGPVTANGLDLLNINRSFGAWQVGSTFLMEDASKPMFDNGASQMPNDPVGAIVTLDAFNTSPQEPNGFDYGFVQSNSITFSNKRAVSAHWNSIRSYDYFRSTFNRNSIDGVGGNIISFINVSEMNGSSMENAFWNGNAMWYGNGGSVFKELARGLDVGGHEMTHGVIEKTANLIYQNESGALNESFADIFGAMIDRDDWKIGEDVVQAGVSPNNCLRDMQNPHNGDSPGGNWWQPQHVSEQYMGPLDNGGVHINSGIPNHAFYLFANNAAVGKEKAEQVFYKALRDYLVKSSKFIDLRIAVIQAATELYGATVANAAASAFTQVGIGNNEPGGNYLGQLNVNPGQDLILCATNDLQDLEIALGNGTILGAIYTEGIMSRPSVTDNGSQLVFVNAEGHIIGFDLSYVGGQINFQDVQLSNFPEWRNAAISKDGRYLAALTKTSNNLIYVFDLLSPGFDSEVFTLYNPTYTTGQVTGDVQYADVLEFDYSGNFLMYDAFNQLSNNQGQDISYWDIGFVQYRENGDFTNGDNAFITKLFSGLPENTSIGNPTFSKNSPFIIAFDVIDDLNGRYDIYGANTETGDYDIIIADNGVLGWPNYNRLDDAIMFESEGFFDLNLYIRGINSSKIQPQGGISTFITDRNWGVWFANGNRSLSVGSGEPQAAATAMQASPNPSKGNLQLRFDAAAGGAAAIRVYSLLGEVLMERHLEAATGNNVLDLDLSALPAGHYFIRLDGAGLHGAVRVIRQ